MDDILQDMSAERLALAVEENLFSWIQLFGLTGEAKFDDPPGVKRSVSSIALSLFNSIMDARLKPDNVQSTIRYIEEDADRRQVPVLWWVGPSTRPENLGNLLLECSFSIDDDGPGMAVLMNDLSEKMPLVEGISLQPVKDDTALQDWCLTMASGFEVPSSVAGSLIDAWRNFMRLVNPETTIAYLARWQGKPVATSLLRLGGGVAGIYAVSTIPEARRKGIGAWVTLQPLLDARELGYQAGVLQSSPMGHGVYQSIGFRDYCQITSYVYRPKK
jgi:GNAT superfamily N-acetyltransferase